MAARHPSIASKAAKAAKAARVAKARRHEAEGKNTVVTPASKAFTDPRDVLLKPVVSEKSYALIDENKYTFMRRAGLQQDPRSGGRPGGLRGQRSPGSTRSTASASASAPAPASASARRPSARS
ncbi:hypothetical protein GCM10023238_13800 [Streptomyces heliomycini]